MSLIVFSILVILLHIIGNFQLESATLCAGDLVTSKPVIDYCNAQGGYLIHRCCRSSDNETFIAVDLMNLTLTKIPNFAEHENFNLTVIDLRDNPGLELSQDEDFLTLKNLDDLILPAHVGCPGQHRVWEVVTNISDPPGNRCMHQKDFCLNLTDTCVAHESFCSTNGPNHFLCLCKSDYHGYKCLRKGTFPAGAFYGSTIGATVVVSVLLYCTQRRHVRK